MADYIDRLLHRFGCVLEINNYYWKHTDGGDDGDRIRVENLVRAVSEITNQKIEKYVVDEESDLERSKCIRYAEGCVILVYKEADERWKRFSVVKELCHIACDDAEEMQSDTVEALVSMLPEHSDSVDDLGAGQPNQHAERLAEYAAVELLYPIDFRDKDIAFVESKAKTYTQISKERGVPEVFVEAYLKRKMNDSMRTMLTLATALRESQKTQD